MTGWPRGRARDGGIDEIPLPHVAGRLWLCGKHAIGPDPDAALARAGASVAVCLTERHEIADRYPGYVEWLDAHAGGRAVWFPIHDLHAPPLDRAAPLVADLVARMRGGEVLLVHCGAGMGRAGTVAACVLVALGTDVDEALRTVAEARPGAGPEVGAQLELVHRLAAGGVADPRR